jgi:hypothetical protein
VCIGAQSARRGPGRHTVRVLTPRACGVGHRIGQACTSMLVYNGGSVSVLCLPLVLRFAVNTASLAPQSLHAPREQVQRSHPTLPPGGICWRSRPPSASASCLSGQPAGRSGHIIIVKHAHSPARGVEAALRPSPRLVDWRSIMRFCHFENMPLDFFCSHPFLHGGKGCCSIPGMLILTHFLSSHFPTPTLSAFENQTWFTGPPPPPPPARKRDEA